LECPDSNNRVRSLNSNLPRRLSSRELGLWKIAAPPLTAQAVSREIVAGLTL
jgi:hypothetical protein